VAVPYETPEILNFQTLRLASSGAMFFGVATWIFPVLFDTLAAETAPACAAHAAASSGPSLLQRSQKHPHQAPLIEELDEGKEDRFHAATHHAATHHKFNCTIFTDLRHQHLVEFPIANGELQAKAEEQLRIAHREVERKRDLNSSLLLQLRELESWRWSQDRVSMNLFNPTVVPLPSSWQQGPEERWLASFRHMELTHNKNDTCVKHSLSNIIVLAILDGHLRPTRPAEILTYQDVLPDDFQCQKAEGPKFLFLGPEDPRLFHMPNDTERILMLFTARTPTNVLGMLCDRCSHLEGRMYLAEIGSDLRPRSVLPGQGYVIPFETEMNGGSPKIGSHVIGGWEKNWGPFAYTDDLGNQQVMIQEAIYPHIVVPMDENFMVRDMVYNTTSPILEEWMRIHFPNMTMRLHGGVAPILFTEALPGVDLEAPFYLSILHTKCPKGGCTREHKSHHNRYLLPVYVNYLFAFEAKPPFAIQRVGHQKLPLRPILSVFWSHVAFPTQMLLTTDGQADAHGDDLSILYGAGDLMSRVLNLPLDHLADYL